MATYQGIVDCRTEQTVTVDLYGLSEDFFVSFQVLIFGFQNGFLDSSIRGYVDSGHIFGRPARTAVAVFALCPNMCRRVRLRTLFCWLSLPVFCEHMHDNMQSEHALLLPLIIVLTVMINGVICALNESRSRGVSNGRFEEER